MLLYYIPTTKSDKIYYFTTFKIVVFQTVLFMKYQVFKYLVLVMVILIREGVEKPTFYGHVRKAGGVNLSLLIEIKKYMFFVLLFNGRRIL